MIARECPHSARRGRWALSECISAQTLLSDTSICTGTRRIPRYVTNNADSIHTFGCYGKILIEDCRMDSMLDDSLNIHGNFTVAESAGGDMILARSPGQRHDEPDEKLSARHEDRGFQWSDD